MQTRNFHFLSDVLKFNYVIRIKENMVKTRTHSLFRQEQYYYDFFHRFTPKEQDYLMEAFQKLLEQHSFWCDFFERQKMTEFMRFISFQPLKSLEVGKNIRFRIFECGEMILNDACLA